VSFFLQVHLDCRYAILKRKQVDENRGFEIEWEEEFVLVKGIQTKNFVLKTEHY
jgi:hypothetical protein